LKQHHKTSNNTSSSSSSHKRSFKVCPPTLPLTSCDVDDDDSSNILQKNYLKLKQSSEMNGCFIAVITREFNMFDSSVLRRGALQGLITPTPTVVTTTTTTPPAANKKPTFVGAGGRIKSNLTLPNELSKKTSGDTFGKSVNKPLKTSKSSKNVGKKSSSGGKNIAAKLKMKQKDLSVNVEEMLSKLQKKTNQDTNEETEQTQAHALSLEFHDKKAVNNFSETHDMFPARSGKHETTTTDIHSLVASSRQTLSNVDIGRC